MKRKKSLTVTTPDPKRPDVERIAAAFKALGNEARLRMFLMIAEHSPADASDAERYWSADDERSCFEVFASKLGLTQPTVSHHVKELRMSNLIKIRRDGVCHSCRTNNDTLRLLAAVLLSHTEQQ